jgi:hypothetical protein
MIDLGGSLAYQFAAAFSSEMLITSAWVVGWCCGSPGLSVLVIAGLGLVGICGWLWLLVAWVVSVA